MIVIKKVTVLGQKKKRKKENILLTARWNGFFLRNCMKREIQVDREMQVPTITGFIKNDLQNSMPSLTT